MFELHETTQRWLCRGAFLALCFAPTLYVVSWAAAVNTPQYEFSWRQAWQSHLETALGLHVDIQRVSHPARGVTLLEGVEITPPESTIPVARARLIEVRPYDGGFLAMASQLEVDADRLETVWTHLHDRVLVRGDETSPTLWFRCAELTLAGAEREQTVVDVSAKLAPSAKEGPTVLAEFELPERASTPCQLAIRRNREGLSATTAIDLQTHSAALPCNVLRGAFQLVDALGERAEFRGRLQLTQSSGGYSGRISNADLLNVETQRLLATCSLHTLRTLANVRIQTAEFRDGRLQSITGGVAAEFGVIDAAFLRALQEHLQIAAPQEVLDARQEKWSFNQLAFDFALNEQDGLTMQGACEGGFQGAMMLGETGPLLLQPRRPHSTAVALIRALVPANDVQAPATRQTQQLVNAFPVPDLTNAAATAPKASLQLRNE